MLNSNNSLYYARFHKDFFPEDIQKKYEKYLKQYPTSFKRFPEFITHTIQKISIPAFNVSLADPQNTGTKNQPIFKKGTDALRKIDRSFKIQFKHIEGYLNYFALMECFYSFHSHDSKQVTIPEFSVNILNQQHQKLYTVTFYNILYDGFTDALEFNYAEVRNQAASFTISFKYNDIEFDFADEGNVLK